MRLAGVIPCSFVDGPGCRYVIFTQGCKHKCKDCQNPQTWNMDGGTDYTIDTILKDLKSESPIDKVTISGGDPFYQELDLIKLCKKLKADNYNVWVYTGFTWDEIKESEALRYIDVVVDSPFLPECKTLELPFRGSSNQRIIDVQKSLESGSLVEMNI